MKKSLHIFYATALFMLACGPAEKEKPAPLPDQITIQSFDDLVDDKNISLDSLKKIMARSGKPVILYFSAFADVNSRKLEEALLAAAQQDPAVKRQTLVMFMVDDRNPLPEHEKYISSMTGEKVNDIGQRGADLQRRFNRYDQPCLLKINGDFKVVDSLTYVDREQQKVFFRQ